MNTIDVPVLLITFNRPDTLAQVLQVVKTAKIKRLYIACDAPRYQNERDKVLVTQVKQVIEKDVDWNCKIQTLFHSENQGCKYGPYKAINWFFENEEEGIILEDDCLPHLDFFDYCAELLERYRHDQRIMTISGDHTPLASTVDFGSPSYGFSKYSLTWGWATWKRAWQTFDLELTSWPYVRSHGWLKGLQHDEDAYNGLYDAFEGVYNQNHNSVWDYQWTFNCLFHQGLSIIPSKNLITNIGFGADSTHTSDSKNPRANIPSESIMPLIHPQLCHPWGEIDYYILKNGLGVRKKPGWKKILKRLLPFKNGRIPYHKIK